MYALAPSYRQAVKQQVSAVADGPARRSMRIEISSTALQLRDKKNIIGEQIARHILVLATFCVTIDERVANNTRVHCDGRSMQVR